MTYIIIQSIPILVLCALWIDVMTAKPWIPNKQSKWLFSRKDKLLWSIGLFIVICTLIFFVFYTL